MSAKVLVSKKLVAFAIVFEFALFVGLLCAIEGCNQSRRQLASSELYYRVEVQHALRSHIALRKANCDLRRRVVELEKDNARIACGPEVDLEGIWEEVPEYQWVEESNSF